MSLELYIKRAKIFMGSTKDGAELHYVAYANAGGQTTRNVPEWVTDTDTYKYGIKDGSIVNLTPPKAVVKAEEPKDADTRGVPNEPLKAQAKDEEPPVDDTEDASDESTVDGEETGEETGEEIPEELVPAGIDPGQPVATGHAAKKAAKKAAKRK